MKQQLQYKQIELINEWCRNARRLGYSKKDVKKKISGYPRHVRKQILKTFKDYEYIQRKNKWFEDMKQMKGGVKMVFKKKAVEEEEDDTEPEIEEEEEMDDLDPESEDEKRPVGRRSNAEKAFNEGVRKSFQKTPAVYRQPEVVVKGGRDWLIRTIPQTFECIDPANGEVILKAGSYEELMLKLQVMATQHSVESAKNTR